MASISSAGGQGGGPIIIQHDGGLRDIPFDLGDATTNGTTGAITTDTGPQGTIAPSQSFPSSFTQGDIQIITQNSQRLPLLESPPAQLPVSDSIPPQPAESLVAQLETRFTRQFEQYLGESATQIQILPGEREILQDIEKATGVKPALVYVGFVPQTVEPSAVERKSLSPKSDNLQQLSPKEVTAVSGTSASPEEGNRSLSEEVRPLVTAQSPAPSTVNPLIKDNDQLEIVVVTANSPPVRKRVPGATRAKVLEVAEKFRGDITNPSKRGTTSYLAPAKQLYQWLVAPLETDLQATRRPESGVPNGHRLALFADRSSP